MGVRDGVSDGGNGVPLRPGNVGAGVSVGAEYLSAAASTSRSVPSSA
ncbi:MAG: hypothetical protein U0559_10370 [Anaerolineae bacterium]